MDQVIHIRDLDVSKIEYTQIRELPSRAKSIGVVYNGKPLIVQTETHGVPFEKSSFGDVEKGESVKTTADLSFKGMDDDNNPNSKKLKKSHQSFCALDNKFLDDSVAVMEASRDNLRVTNLGNLIFLLIEGIAVFMMFNLKRNGFWLYTIAQIGLVSLMIMVMPWPNLISTLTLCVTLFLVILFEILYAVNLKHMKA